VNLADGKPSLKTRRAQGFKGFVAETTFAKEAKE